MKQITLTLLALFFIQTIQAQGQFERLYRTNGRNHLGVDIQQTSDGGYLMLSITRNETNNELEKANVTKLNPKGNIDWSQDYDFEENLSPVGEILVLQQDSFAFAVVESGTEMNKILTKADPIGEVVWSHAYGNPSFLPLDLPVEDPVELTANYDRGFSIFGQQGEVTSSGFYAARTDSLGNILWAKNYLPVDNTPPFVVNMNGIQDAQVTQDSGFILVGRSSEFVSEADMVLMKLDSFGNIEWSKNYGDNSVFGSEFGNAVAQTPDGGYGLCYCWFLCDRRFTSRF